MGREFRDAGVVSAGDMTTEACTTKLAYLFGMLEDQVMVEKWLCRNIRGELTLHNQHRKFFNEIMPHTLPHASSHSSLLSNSDGTI